MSTLIPIEDLDIDWTGSAVVMHQTLDNGQPHAETTCPCGWRHVHPSGFIFHREPHALAVEHAATHEGTVHCIIRDRRGEITQEWDVPPAEHVMANLDDCPGCISTGHPGSMATHGIHIDLLADGLLHPELELDLFTATGVKV